VSASVIDQFGFFQFAIMHCSRDDALRDICTQLNDWKHRPYRVESAHLDVRRILLSDQGPHNPPDICNGYLLVEASGRDGTKTLFVSSVSDGANSLLICLSRVMPRGVLGFRVENLRRQYPANKLFQFENFEVTRLVRVMKETRWEYFELGKPLWFEDSELYSARIKKARLTPEVLSGYIRKLGYGSLDGAFWTDPQLMATYIIEEGFNPWNERDAPR
jgi:hypothetical protein